MNYKISALTKQQVNDFWQIFSQVLSTEFPGYSKAVVRYLLDKIYTPANYYYWISYNLKTVLIASAQDRIVGFAVVDEPYGGVSFCRWLGVKKNYQKQGIGRSLMEEWIKLAKNQGCHKVEIASQPEAKSFYETVGLQLEGFRKLSYFGIDQYIFGRVIGTPNDQAMTRVK